MIRYFYKMDEHFKKAYDESEETPSDESWDEIAARLDEADARLYKIKFRRWKATALILLVVFGSYGLFESVRWLNQSSPVAQAGNSTAYRPHQSPAPRFGPSPAQALGMAPTTTMDGLKRPSRTSGKLEHNHLALPVRAYVVKATKIIDPPSLHFATIDATTTSLAGVGNLVVFDPSVQRSAVLRLSQLSNQTLEPTSPPTHKIQRWSLLASASLDHADYRIDDDGPHMDSKAKIEGRETHNASFSASLTTRYTISRCWSLQSGLRYSNTLIGIDPHEIYAEQNSAGQPSYKYVTSSGYAYISPGFGTGADSVQTTSARHHLVFVSVPFLVNYRITHDRWRFVPSLGLQMNWLAKASVKTEVQQGTQTEAVSIHQLEGRKSFYISYVAEAGIEYTLARPWAISLTPSFQYGITSITRNNAVNTFPYSVGMALGVNYHF